MNPTTQRLAALRSANTVRRERAVHKRKLADTPYPRSLAAAAQLVTNHAEHLAGMQVEQVLAACRGMATVKTNTLLRRAGVAPWARLGELAPGERHALIREIRLQIARAAA